MTSASPPSAPAVDPVVFQVLPGDDGKFIRIFTDPTIVTPLSGDASQFRVIYDGLEDEPTAAELEGDILLLINDAWTDPLLMQAVAYNKLGPPDWSSASGGVLRTFSSLPIPFP